MDRTEILLSLFDSSGFGLEVGPSYNPLVPKSKGYKVETVDHADATTLRKKYSDNASQIEEVDYVSDGQGLLELIGSPQRYDYIVASHVIEHVTDIVKFLRDCSTLLKPSGVLVLAVPDKRYCFDTLRPVSTVGQALQAYIEKRTRHTPGMLFDHVVSVSKKAGNIVWVEPTLDNIEFAHTRNDAKNLFETSQTSTEYIDTHAWQFTPSYFRYFIKMLRSLGYIQLAEENFHKNEKLGLHEFYVTLSKNAPMLETSDLELLRASEQELREIRISRASGQLEQDLSSKNAEIDSLKKALEQALSEKEATQSQRDALLHSSSWKLTAPLRSIKSVLGGH